MSLRELVPSVLFPQPPATAASPVLVPKLKRAGLVLSPPPFRLVTTGVPFAWGSLMLRTMSIIPPLGDVVLARLGTCCFDE
jgi:hypothetical protein